MPDFKPHSLKFAAQLVIPKAQHLDALFREKPISLFILGMLVGKTVPAAVEFDGEFRDGAVEIEVVNTACILAAEFEFGEASITKQAPKALLGVSRFLAELAGEIAGSSDTGAVFAVLWRSPPHPDPLPRWRRGNLARTVVCRSSSSFALVHGFSPNSKSILFPF